MLFSVIPMLLLPLEPYNEMIHRGNGHVHIYKMTFSKLLLCGLLGSYSPLRSVPSEHCVNLCNLGRVKISLDS